MILGQEDEQRCTVDRYLDMASPGVSMLPSHTLGGPSMPSAYSTENTLPPAHRMRCFCSPRDDRQENSGARNGNFHPTRGVNFAPFQHKSSIHNFSRCFFSRSSPPPDSDGFFPPTNDFRPFPTTREGKQRNVPRGDMRARSRRAAESFFAEKATGDGRVKIENDLEL